MVKSPPDELGVKAIDDYTLEITTEAKALYLPGDHGIPDQRSSTKGRGRKGGEPIGPCGSSDWPLSNGPWKMTKYEPGRRDRA